MKITRRPASSGIFSEENKERFYRVTEIARRAVHYGWIPLIMLIGNSEYYVLYCANIHFQFYRVHSIRSQTFIS